MGRVKYISEGIEEMFTTAWGLREEAELSTSLCDSLNVPLFSVFMYWTKEGGFFWEKNTDIGSCLFTMDGVS